MTTAKTQTWFVYILRCADNTLYTGVTTDMQRRIMEHNHDKRLGARYTRARRPVRLVYHESCTDRSHALRREHAIRALSKQNKEKLLFTGSPARIKRIGAPIALETD